MSSKLRTSTNSFAISFVKIVQHTPNEKRSQATPSLGFFDLFGGERYLLVEINVAVAIGEPLSFVESSIVVVVAGLVRVVRDPVDVVPRR